MQAAIAPNELERLTALRDLDILDTDAEPEFDELVTLAAALCSTPISLVSLVDENRQWFKAAIGLPFRETPRDVAFCSHAILEPFVFTVEDATADPRFADNPMVTGDTDIRFYAGIPVSDPEGLLVGTLCVLDTVPRKLTPEQNRALEILARQVNVRLELRTQRKTLQHLLVEKQETLNTLRETQKQLEQANCRLEALATTDALTSLLNRRVFDERLAEEYRRSRRRGSPLCLAMLDIDNFKRRNDLYGHDAGDAALRQFAAVLQSSARQTDIAVRYGGEEFAILLPETDSNQAQLLMDRILQAVRSTVWQHQPLTVSIGLAELDVINDADVAPLLKRADLALYAAKAAGKDQLRCTFAEA